MVHAAAPSVTEQYEYANMRRIPILVTLHGATFTATDTVRVSVHAHGALFPLQSCACSQRMVDPLAAVATV